MSSTSQELLHIVVSTIKEESVLVYFMLESNEGLAFYSTVPNEKGDLLRKIDIKSSRTLEKEVRGLLSIVKRVAPSLEIITDEYVADHVGLELTF